MFEDLLFDAKKYAILKISPAFVKWTYPITYGDSKLERDLSVFPVLEIHQGPCREIRGQLRQITVCMNTIVALSPSDPNNIHGSRARRARQAPLAGVKCWVFHLTMHLF